MPDHRRDKLRLLAMRSHQVVTMAVITGAITGLIVAGFDRLVIGVIFDHVLRLPSWVLGFLPGLGLLIAFAARRVIGGRGVTPSTSDEYLHSFHEANHSLGWRPLIARLVAAVATLGSGNPMGLEGPSMYAGATVGTHLQDRFKNTFGDTDRRTLLVAGAAAGVSAIFKAPATGAVFALEVPYRGDLARRMLLPALVASATGYLVFAAINGTNALFPIAGTPAFKFREFLGVAVIGVVAGLGARLFGWLLRHAKRLAASTHPLLMTIAAGIVIGGLFAIGMALTDKSLVLGSGYRIIDWAGDPTHSAWLLLAMLAIRCLATSAAVAGGGVGGLFVPLVVAGALTGALIGGLVYKSDLELFIVIGVAAFLGAGYRVPLAAVMFVAETTGRPSFVVPGLIAAVAAELVMGRSSISAYQKDPPEVTVADT